MEKMNQPELFRQARVYQIAWIVSLATTIALLSFVIVITAVGIDLKYNFESKAKQREDKAVAQVVAKMEAEFEQREKQPFRKFIGPDDLGQVSFQYPKTWSSYIAKEGQPYEVMFNPTIVRHNSSNRRYALRLVIEGQQYERVIAKYDALIKKGDLKQSIVTINGHKGTRLDGQFSNKITGSVVIFKIRDKTVTVATDADQAFREDFNKIIASLTFNE